MEQLGGLVKGRNKGRRAEAEKDRSLERSRERNCRPLSLGDFQRTVKPFGLKASDVTGPGVQTVAAVGHDNSCRESHFPRPMHVL